MCACVCVSLFIVYKNPFYMILFTTIVAGSFKVRFTVYVVKIIIVWPFLSIDAVLRFKIFENSIQGTDVAKVDKIILSAQGNIEISALFFGSIVF